MGDQIKNHLNLLALDTFMKGDNIHGKAWTYHHHGVDSA
jgi:hypothetical protein